MFILVKLLNGCPQLLTYKIPDSWPQKIYKNLMGTLVTVPLQKRTELALVQEVFEILPATTTFRIKDAYERETLPNDQFYLSFIKKLAQYYAIDYSYFFKRICHFLSEKEYVDLEILPNSLPIDQEHISSNHLTEQQKTIADTLSQALTQAQYYPALLRGVTGSGKTEIYKHLITQALSLGKTVLLLLPEVSLAVQFQHILKKQLSADTKLFGFHSATSIKEKRALWSAILQEHPIIIVGVHLPVLLPIANLGLIVIDEEHEVGYQEKKHPRINTKEAALLRAQLYKIPIILGSATPSIASLHNTQHKGWHLFELQQRFAGNFAQIQLVKLTKEKKRSSFWISQELSDAIKQRLKAQEQIIIFLNRRGYSFFIQCKECGHIPTCTACSVSLTLHETQKLICHYCNFTLVCPISCSGCKAPESALLKKGIGTQQIVTILQKLFPAARIARADLDTTKDKKKWRNIIEQFELGTIDILVGTQTITKGYHFPKVTLVGILWADVNLHIPFYNAAEVTLQQLIQVSGRAGRATQHSLVIVQSIIDHPIFKYLNELDYPQFYEHELTNRNIVMYPPCTRLAEIEIRHHENYIVDQEAQTLTDTIFAYIAKQNLDIILLGPAQPAVHMIKNTHIRKIYLKSPSIQAILQTYFSINKTQYKSSLFFTPNPLS